MSDLPEQVDSAATAKPSIVAQWSPALLVIGLIALYYVTTRPTPLPEGWHDSYEATLTEASATNRKLLLAFHSPGCPPCDAMEREVLASAAVRSSLRDYLPVRVDATSERELANRFGVSGTPTYAIVDGHGRLMSRCMGYQPIEDFVTFLDHSSHGERASMPSAAARPPGGP